MVKKRAKRISTTINIDVAVLGSAVTPVELDPEACTVADALEAAGLDSNTSCKVSGEPVADTDELEDGDRLIIAREVKGA